MLSQPPVKSQGLGDRPIDPALYKIGGVRRAGMIKKGKNVRQSFADNEPELIHNRLYV